MVFMSNVVDIIYMLRMMHIKRNLQTALRKVGWTITYIMHKEVHDDT